MSNRSVISGTQPWNWATAASHVHTDQAVVGVQYLRAFAALLVVLFHAELHLTKVHPVSGLFDFGSAGVDIFFVISGFIIQHVTRARNNRPGDFALRRAIRVVPLYWIYTTLYIVILAAVPSLSQKGIDVAHAVKSYLFIPALHPTEGRIAPVLLPGWTLNYEMFFYAIFAAFICLRQRLAVVIGLMLALVCVGTVVRSEIPAVSVYTNPILIEFASGAIIAELFARRVQVPGALSVVMLGVACAVIFSVVPEGSFARVIFWGVPAVILVAAVVLWETGRKMPRIAVAQLFGDASYSLYLSHVFVIPAVVVLWKKIGGENLPDGLYFLLTISVAQLVGIVSYVAIERPFTRTLNSRIRGASTRAAPLQQLLLRQPRRT